MKRSERAGVFGRKLPGRELPGRSLSGRSLLGRMLRTWFGELGLGTRLAGVWVGALVVCAITASWLPLPSIGIDPTRGLLPPSIRHPFGTTRLGEDIFALCVHGCRVAVAVAIGAPLFGAVFGVPVGMVSGYLGGRIDRVLSTIVDAALALPVLIVSVVIVSYRGQSLVTVVLLLGVLFSAPVARFTRTATRAITQSDYVVVAKSLGAPTKRILWTELRPNITRPMFAFFALLSGAGVLAEGGLSFIGLGVPLENASWGRLIAGGRPELATAWWWAMCPAAVFFLTSLGLNVLADHFGGVQPLRKKRSERWSSQKGVHRSTSRISADASINPCAAGYSVLHSFNSAAAPGPRTGTAPALLVRDLTVSVPTPNGTIELVSGANLFVNPGEIVAIVGTSGAGKTSLVQAICGATSGRYIHGLVLAPSGVERVPTPARPGRDTALVMQEPRRSLDAVTHVGWQIAEPARVHFGLSRRAARARAIELLVAVGMDDPQHRFFSYPHQLSGGQCQRIAIALALACDPSVLVADEPTGSLDPIARRQILDLLDRLRSERNLAVLLVTHDRAIASGRADRVITMEQGLITAVS